MSLYGYIPIKLSSPPATRIRPPSMNMLPASNLEANFASFGMPLKIIVGNENTEFYLPKDVVCDVSEYFNAACSPDWDSGGTGTVNLNEEDPKLFMLFATWITRGNVSSCTEFARIDASNEEEERTQRLAQWHQLAEAFILGGFLLAPGFKNAVIDILVSVSRTLVEEHDEVGGTTAPTLQLLYEKTEPSSQIRQLVLDLAITHLGVEKLRRADMSLPWNVDFCRAMAIHSMQYVQSHIGQNGLNPIVPWDHWPEYYHEYPEDKSEDIRKKRRAG